MLDSKISIDCNFDDKYICGYRQMNDIKHAIWERSEFNLVYGKTNYQREKNLNKCQMSTICARFDSLVI